MMKRGDWKAAHNEVVALGLARAKHEQALGQALLRAYRAETWTALGMASFYEYCERFVGLRPRQTEERMRVARSLETLPMMNETLAEGRIHFTAARSLTRVATPETEAAWVQAAIGKTIEQVEQLVSGRTRGDLPHDPARPEVRRRMIVLEVSPETYATYREAVAKLRRRTAALMSEEDGLLLMARTVLEGPKDPGRSSYQIRMAMCPSCGHAEQEGRGRSVPVDSVVAEVAQCDAQRIDDKGDAKQDIPPKTRRFVMRRQNGTCGVPGCRNAVFNDVHHVTLRSEKGTHDPDQLLVICSAHHKAVHRGALIIEGSWSSGLRFLHADGSPYGMVEDPHAAFVLAGVHRSLMQLGFKHSQARNLVSGIRPHVRADVPMEAALQLALDAWQQPLPQAA